MGRHDNSGRTHSAMTDLNLSMFRSNDIRTRAVLLTDELALRLARAEACYMRDVLEVDGAVIAHDARASGPKLMEITAHAYADAGLNCVVLPGVTGVCQFYYAAMRHADLAGVFIGASHNPAGDTGRKLVGPYVTPLARGIGPEGGLSKIEELYRSDLSGSHSASHLRRRGRITAFDATPGYISFSLRLAQVQPGDLKRVRVLHDYLNAAGARELMLGFTAAEACLTPLHFSPDSAFPLGDPNPVKQDVIAQGLSELATGGYDLAMFFDGDADRLDVYLSDGTLLASSFVYAAILPLIIKRMTAAKQADMSPIPFMAAPQHPVVFADTKSNPLAVAEMTRAGASVRLIRSGHSHIKHAMLNDEAAIGTVEESAHFYESFVLDGIRFCTENTLYFALLTARAWKESPERFAQMAALQASTGREREWGYVFPDDGKRAEALEAVRARLAASGAEVVTAMTDGTPLEADLLRCGLPAVGHADQSDFDGLGSTSRRSPLGRSRISEPVSEASADLGATEWYQVSQRVSQSEDHLARWEVSASHQALATELKAEIGRIAARYGAGPEYQG